MATAGFITPTERDIYRGYERQRRLRLSRIIGPLFTVLLFLALISLVLQYLAEPNTPPQPPPVIITYAVCFLLYAISIPFVRRQQDVLAATCIAASTFIVITTYMASNIHIQGFGPLSLVVFGGYLTTIVLAGLIGNVTLLFVMTLACNVVSVWLYLLAPTQSDQTITAQLPIAISSAITQQWAVTGVVFAAIQGIRRTQRELGDVRIQYERAKQLDALKDQFISSVNHELRNPIMALQGSLEPLMLGIEHGIEQAELLDLAKRGNRIVDNLANIVTSVLEVRNLANARQGPLQPVAVRAAVVEAANLLAPVPNDRQARDVRLQIASDIAVLADPIRLQRVLLNLLSNATKYSPPGMPLDIRARIVPNQKHKMVEITVRDFGQGIPAEYQGLLFNRFVRLERDLASNIPGSGLGLFLSKQLIEGMGGRIWLESSGIDGEGTTFYVQLPHAPIALAAQRELETDMQHSG